jgi:hypothetical protein
MTHKANDQYPDLTLTNLGCEYRTTVPTWKSLSAEAFVKAYNAAKKTTFSFTPSKVQIRGEEVKLFTA